MESEGRCECGYLGVKDWCGLTLHCTPMSAIPAMPHKTSPAISPILIAIRHPWAGHPPARSPHHQYSSQLPLGKLAKRHGLRKNRGALDKSVHGEQSLCTINFVFPFFLFFYIGPWIFKEALNQLSATEIESESVHRLDIWGNYGRKRKAPMGWMVWTVTLAGQTPCLRETNIEKKERKE